MSDYHVTVLATGPNGLGVIRSLHLKKCTIDIVTLAATDVANFSRIPNKKKVISAGDDKARKQQLLDYLNAQPSGQILIPTSDWFVSFLSENRQQLASKFHFFIPNDDLADILIDKALETKAVQPHIPFPKTVIELFDAKSLLDTLRLPIIIKPRSHHFKALGRKNAILTTEADVESFFYDYSGKTDEMIAQEIIPGDDSEQWVCNCIFDHNSELVQAFTFNRLNLAPAHFGVTSYAVSRLNQDVIDSVSILGKKLSYVGPAMIEFKRDPRDNEYKYIETNPRLGMCNYFDTYCGINNAYSLCQLATNVSVPKKQLEFTQNVIFISFYEDLLSRKSQGQSVFSTLSFYCNGFFKRHAFIYYVWWDPLPAFQMLKCQLTKFIFNRPSNDKTGRLR